MLDYKDIQKSTCFAEISSFLNFRKFKILQDNGKISKAQAEQKATEEYNEFNKTQKIISDFDKHIAGLNENE